MELLEKKGHSKDNKELRKLVSLKLGKMPNEQISDDEFQKISEISLNSRLLNGQESGIGLDAISLFRNIKKLKLSNYKITQEAINAIASLECLEDLEIFGAEFDKDINWGNFGAAFKSLRFRNCLPINFAYPSVSNIWLDQTDIDFSRIDLQSAKRITILNGKILNAHDLTDFPNIESVNLDGSTLIGKDEKQIEEISVNPQTKYTHEKMVKLFDRATSRD